LSRNEDIPRFIQFFEESIASNTLNKYKIFDTTKGKVRNLKDETDEFNKLKDEREKQMH
jgi:DnaJ family protein C protein 9